MHFAVSGTKLCRDPQLCYTVLAHACTLIGFSVGSADRPNAPPTHRFFSSSSTWRRNRPRIIIYYARLPDHQRPSRRGLRIPASPGHGYVRGPGFPTPLVTPVTPNLHSPDRPQFRMASMRPGAGGCVRRRACLRTPPPAPGPHGFPMHLGGRQMVLRDHGIAGGAVIRGPRTWPWPGAWAGVMAARAG